MCDIWHLCDFPFLAFTFHLARGNMWFQPSVEIGGADASVHDGADDQDDGDDRKCCQRLSHRIIFCHFGRLIHAGELEEEIR